MVWPLAMGRRGIGLDTSQEYLTVAEGKVSSMQGQRKQTPEPDVSLPEVGAV